jgi:oligosaccharide translocation protein RFT1
MYKGVYDIITNLGSLIARIVFLPIEESFYVYFASVLIRGDTALVQSKAVIQSTSRALSLILKLVSLIALVILVFGNSYSELALDIYGGQILSQGAGPILLRSFCVYLLFLAVNGMTECFMFSSMSQERVNRYNNVMVIFSITFLCAAALLIQIFGSVGFIFANCINMATRIVYSTRFIYNFYKPVSLNPLWDAVPSTQVWLSLLLSFMITVISMNIFCCQFGYIYSFIHVFIGSVCLLLVAFVVLFIENDLCQFLFQRLPHKFQRILQTIKVQTIKYDKTN